MKKKKGELKENREILTSAKQPRKSCISLDAMDAGKDEMNLVEFPLAGLSDRSPAGDASLVFEDTIWDRGRRAKTCRRLTITGSAKYKLPTPLDDEVVLGLVQLSRAQRFESREVSFRPVDLIRLLGWRTEGRSYSRLEKSLRRWLGITLYYESAWWDNAQKAWVDEHFHLIDHVVIRRRSAGSAKGRVAHTVIWSIVWNEVVFRSFEAGYLRSLDMKLYRKLKSAAAKRMYRFLDKRFDRSNHLEFDLKVFACEHIGFSRAYDNSQLKRRLKSAIAELEGAGYLEPLPPTERFPKVCRGMWKTRLIRRQSSRRQGKTRSRWHALENALAERGVTPAAATRLVHEHSHKTIREKVREFDRLQGTKGGMELRNPPGFLVKSIEDGGLCAVEEKPTRMQKAMPESENALTPETGVHPGTSGEKTRQEEKESEVIENYLAGLSDEDIEKLEIEAFRHASPMLATGYERSRKDDNARLTEKYRKMVLHSHVRNLMGFGAGSHSKRA